ncbi:unnamed protein product (macronuclear) [Paramecium tetraurelia]|uniref:Uncharacterized protein n=1 Tax=Paramecium tetraurelia TaxID=5888 RepID=A0C0Z0_PARTE|nr:uncharacterized protein GSPATT00033933001 [Paramecium tetraurelia]CAK64457.1 unnamed protein product [Paramecium tetraurelia]|eukprot:XP_001431855.1 hypothetical protein (macronuclear) [Paramecium tetraurelia strain d4-2]
MYKGLEYSKEQLANIPKPFKAQLTTEEGRRQFEVNVNRFIDLYPGAIVREGEKILISKDSMLLKQSIIIETSANLIHL